MKLRTRLTEEAVKPPLFDVLFGKCVRNNLEIVEMGEGKQNQGLFLV